MFLTRKAKPLLILAAATLSACQTLSGQNTIAEISTVPSGAQVTVEGLGSCITPCTVDVTKTRRVAIAKAGFLKEERVLEAGQRRLALDLQLAAPSTDVSETSLPDL
ncbi:MAG: PEGA domain-containing protein [Pseudomonadota bacterium]